MKRQAFVLFVSALMPLSAFAQSGDSHQCTLNGLERRVEIERSSPAGVPCEVVYFKDSEAPGERYVLWTASNEVNYCESQAEGFLEQLESWGWQCQASTNPAPAAPITDDTGVLTPVTE